MGIVPPCPLQMIHAQRQAVDPIGWCAEAFEWASTYILSKEFRLPFLSSHATDASVLASQSGPRTAYAHCPFLMPQIAQADLTPFYSRSSVTKSRSALSTT